MQTLRMVTIAPHAYAGHALRAGDEYDCEAQHVAHFEKLGWARRKDAPQNAELPGQAGQNAQNYGTRDMRAARGSRATRATK